jgi:hypothetical protein
LEPSSSSSSSSSSRSWVTFKLATRLF